MNAEAAPARSPLRHLTLALAAALLIAGCERAGSTAPEVGAAPAVGVYTVQEQPLSLTTELPGRTVAYRSAEVRPQVDGIIQQRLFTEGALVQAGEPLYQIDDAPYKAALLRAEADLAAAENLARRYERLVGTEAVSRQQYEDAQAAWKQAQAALEMARIDMRYTRVLAPISGRVGRSSVTEGALVTRGQAQPLATVQQLDPIHVDLSQPVGELLRLRRALAEGRIEQAGEQQAEVGLRLEDGSDYALKGSLRFAEVAVDPGTASVTLRAEFPNPDGLLLPGMFVRASLIEGVRSNALLLPQQALVRDPSGAAMVWVVTSAGTIERRDVSVLRSVGNAWLIGDGLAHGEQVVTEGTHLVQPGMQVETFAATNVRLVTEFGAQARGGH